MNHFFKERLRSVLASLTSLRLTFKEYSRIIGYDPKSRLESLMLVATHSLEKGMGIKDTRIGYGKQKAINIINYLSDYCKHQYNCNCFPFLECYHMIETYIKFQKDNGYDISDIEQLFDSFKEKYKASISDLSFDVKCGYEFIDATELKTASNYDFEHFISLRHSIRDFTDEIVPEDILRKAVQIANLSPSACNRQPVKVYCTKSIETADKVDDLITGTTGFKKAIHNFALITCDRSYFNGREIYQWYTNGGIYLSFFVLALHSLGIGSIIMQWFAFHNTEKQLKTLMNISKTEAIIAVVGYGYYPDSVKCINAQRKSVDETITTV